MPDGPMTPPGVILPWAQHFDASAAHEQASRERVDESVRELRVATDGFRVKPQHRQQFLDSPPMSKELPPELRALGLPARPAPMVPDFDREHLIQEDLMGAAVALDVLTTHTSELTHSSDVLDGMTHALVRVGAMGELDDAMVQIMSQEIAGEVGRQRARLSRDLCAVVGENALPHEGDATHEPLASTPRTVLAAARRLELMAETIVREAHLLLDAREPVAYKQA